MNIKPRTIVFIVFILAVLVFLIIVSPQQEHKPIEPTTGNKAAIIDHLSISQPNQIFVENATAILEEAGYEVHYFGGEEITVDFYRNLPTKGFSFIILRVHSTGESTVEEVELDWIVLFTSEPYSNLKYLYPEQTNGELVFVRFTQEDSPKYFGITPLFVRNRMNGDFNETAIIMMGCEGLKYYSMAQAFKQRGAKVYISWTGPVSAKHTDIATTHLLEHLLLERITVGEAITKIQNEVGPDPSFDSKIMFYPITATQYTIPKPSKQE